MSRGAGRGAAPIRLKVVRRWLERTGWRRLAAASGHPQWERDGRRVQLPTSHSDDMDYPTALNLSRHLGYRSLSELTRAVREGR